MLHRMFDEHRGLTLFVLFGALGQATLLEAIMPSTPSQRWWAVVRVALLLGPWVLTVLGEILAIEPISRRARRVGLWFMVVGTAAYLAMNAGCAALPWLVERWELALLSTGPSTVTMGLSLRFALRALAAGDVVAPREELWAPPRSWAHAIERQLWLTGGTAIAIGALALVMLALGCVALWRSPERWMRLAPSLAMFSFSALAAWQIAKARRSELRERYGASSDRAR